MEMIVLTAYDFEIIIKATAHLIDWILSRTLGTIYRRTTHQAVLRFNLRDLL